jgi:hypothetical protein
MAMGKYSSLGFWVATLILRTRKNKEDCLPVKVEKEK